MEKELDWLALNGVNVVLDATAQEEVWRRFLTELGYTHQEAKDFIAGPAYYAWAYIGKSFRLWRPVHDTWFTERTELARKNQLIMRKLGMQPVLQGYSRNGAGRYYFQRSFGRSDQAGNLVFFPAAKYAEDRQ